MSHPFELQLTELQAVFDSPSASLDVQESSVTTNSDNTSMPIDPTQGETEDSNVVTQALEEDGGFTTQSLAEDGGDFTSMALGEEGGDVTTMMLGEEGGATTEAFGEEGGDVTTDALGEDGGDFTTMALGEEGGDVTTMMLGEEGGATTEAFGEDGGVVTTMALGEEGGTVTTLALGEEGGVTTEAVGEEGGEFPGGFNDSITGFGEPTNTTGTNPELPVINEVISDSQLVSLGISEVNIPIDETQVDLLVLGCPMSVKATFGSVGGDGFL